MEDEIIEKVVSLMKSTDKLEINFDQLDVDKLRVAKNRSILSNKHKIAVSIDNTAQKITMTKFGVGVAKEEVKEEVKEEEKEEKFEEINEFREHTYIKPYFHEDMINAILDPSAPVIYGVGGTGSGKTHHLRIIAKEMDREMVLINCKRDMSTASFLGDKTIVIDEKTKQNYVKWIDGPVVKAMQTGLNEKGEVIGKPAILVIDEAPVMPSHIAIGFNNLLENYSSKRRIVIDDDGGRVVTSHPEFRIVMLGNTIGKGITSLKDAHYTAQADALDQSTLDRVSVIFQYGYNRKAEENILVEKIGNPAIRKKLLKVRDIVRNRLKNGDLTTPFSTRTIVYIADNYRIFKQDIGKALYYGIFTKLLPDERQFYNETIQAVFGVDILKQFEFAENYD